MEVEAGDKDGIAFPGEQENLAKAVKAAAGASKKMIVAMASGSPLVSEWAFTNADAVLAIGYGGQEAGNGLVDVLFNEPEGPSGKTTVTYYKLEQLGDFMSYNMSGSLGPTGKTYRWLTSEPFYRFGHGKTYTVFNYSAVTVNPEESADPCQEVVITASIANSGTEFVGAEIAQLYLHASPNASFMTPPIKLIGFARTPALQPGESAQVSFIVTPEHRSVTSDYAHEQIVEPGQFYLSLGGHHPADNYDAVLRASFVNIGGISPLKRCGQGKHGAHLHSNGHHVSWV